MIQALRSAARRYIASHKLTQAAFGERVGLSQTAVANFLNGNTCPRGEVLDAIEGLVRSPEVVFADELQAIVDFLRLPDIEIGIKVDHLVTRVRSLHATLEMAGGRVERSHRKSVEPTRGGSLHD